MEIELGIVPLLIVTVVQLVKPFTKRYHLVGYLVALFGSTGVVLYSMDEESFYSLNMFSGLKLFIEIIFSSVFTFMTATKSYDLLYGDKKNLKELNDIIDKRITEEKLSV